MKAGAAERVVKRVAVKRREPHLLQRTPTSSSVRQPARWVSIAATAMVPRAREDLARAVADLQRLDPSISIGSINRRMPANHRCVLEAALRLAGLPE